MILWWDKTHHITLYLYMLHDQWGASNAELDDVDCEGIELFRVVLDHRFKKVKESVDIELKSAH